MRAAAAGVLLALFALELGVRLLGIDRRLTVRGAYCQGADPAVHRLSDDPFLHYELRPSSRNPVIPSRFGLYQVSVGATGARGPDRAVPDDAFRILFTGASSLYGAEINDEDTLPRAVERALDRPERPVVVRNHAVSAYNVEQVARLTRRLLEQVRPGLTVVHLANHRRRAFLCSSAEDRRYTWERFLAEPDLYAENFDSSLPGWLVGGSAAARALAALHPEPLFPETYPEVGGLRDAAQAAGAPLVFVRLPCGGDLPAPARPNERHLVLAQADAPQADWPVYLAHPEPATLRAFGAVLARRLEEAGLVPAASGTARADAAAP